MTSLAQPETFTPTETYTEDVSADGFYCFTSHQFVVREVVSCQLAVTGDRSHTPREQDVLIEYRAEVVRVVRLPDQRFGVACRFMN
jgi:hypothetical protein